MSERYSKLFALPENLYAAGSPVVIAAGALLKDNQTGKVIAQLKMRNISQKSIKAAKVCIYPLDTVGNSLGEKIEYQYLDLSAARDEDFGQKAPVALPDAATRSFTASVEEVVFADNSIWSAPGELWEVLDTPGSLRSIGDAELIKQFCMKYGNNCKNLPLLHKDLWYCACGELNRQGEAECHRCRKSFALLEQIDMDALRKERDTRVAAEKEQAEKEAAEAKAHAKKMGKIAAIVVPILVVLIVAAVFISNAVKKSNAYEFALSLVESGQYADAIEHFSALGDYKDSAEQIQIAETAMLEEQNAKAYADATALMEAGRYKQAMDAFEAIREYKDSKEILVELLELVELEEKESNYQKALQLLANSSYDNNLKAYLILQDLGEYEDAASILQSFEYVMQDMGTNDVLVYNSTDCYEGTSFPKLEFYLGKKISASTSQWKYGIGYRYANGDVGSTDYRDSDGFLLRYGFTRKKAKNVSGVTYYLFFDDKGNALRTSIVSSYGRWYTDVDIIHAENVQAYIDANKWTFY